MRRLIAPLLTGLVTSLALAACGSSGSDGSGGTSSGGAGATGGSSAGGSGGATGGTSGAGGSVATGGTGGAGTSFACGALATCQPGQYCEKTIGGACGGNPPDDAGACEPNCFPTTCGSSGQVCLCQSFSCKALPSGCTACACANAGCDCSEDGKGGVFVTCAAP